jgi:hypothetical protein
MKNCLSSTVVTAAFALLAPGVLAQVPKEQLRVPPATADRFVIVSPAWWTVILPSGSATSGVRCG